MVIRFKRLFLNIALLSILLTTADTQTGWFDSVKNFVCNNRVTLAVASLTSALSVATYFIPAQYQKIKIALGLGTLVSGLYSYYKVDRQIFAPKYIEKIRKKHIYCNNLVAENSNGIAVYNWKAIEKPLAWNICGDSDKQEIINAFSNGHSCKKILEQLKAKITAELKEISEDIKYLESYIDKKDLPTAEQISSLKRLTHTDITGLIKPTNELEKLVIETYIVLVVKYSRNFAILNLLNK